MRPKYYSGLFVFLVAAVVVSMAPGIGATSTASIPRELTWHEGLKIGTFPPPPPLLIRQISDEQLWREAYEKQTGISYQRYTSASAVLKDFPGISEAVINEVGVHVEGRVEAIEQARGSLSAIGEKVTSTRSTNGDKVRASPLAALGTISWIPGGKITVDGGGSLGQCSTGWFFYRQVSTSVTHWYQATAAHCVYKPDNTPYLPNPAIVHDYQGPGPYWIPPGPVGNGLTSIPYYNWQTEQAHCCTSPSYPQNGQRDYALMYLGTTSSPSIPGPGVTKTFWNYCGSGTPNCSHRLANGAVNQGGVWGPVVGRATPSTGAAVCKTGYQTGTSCGTYVGLEVGVTNPRAVIDGALTGCVLNAQGDSGAGWFTIDASGARAFGIASGGAVQVYNTNCTLDSGEPP